MVVREATLADAAAIARVHVDAWRTTYRGIVPDTYLDTLSYAEREDMWKRALGSSERGGIVLVAEDEQEQIVGFVSGGPSRESDPAYKSELYAIYVLDEYQGQGIGRQLVAALAQRLLDAGVDSMLLCVFKGNPARRFYEGLGGRFLEEKEFELAGATITEVLYGWTDIRPLAGNGATS